LIIYLDKMQKRFWMPIVERELRKKSSQRVVSSKEGVTTNMYFDIQTVFCSVI